MPKSGPETIACLVPGCQNDTRSPLSGKQGMLCGPHWFELKLNTRRLWWTETDYGKKAPSQELRATVVAELRKAGAL